MRQIYTNPDKEKLLDLIVEVAMLTHESGIQVAEKLDVPRDIIFDLRQRAFRVAMVSPCKCEDCDPKTVDRQKNIERRKFLHKMTKGFV